MNAERHPEEIEHDIEQTRADLSETLDAIERKLSPRQLMDHAMDTMRSSEAQAWVASTVKENPVPLALIGLGLGWLIVSNMSRGSGRSELDYDYAGYDETGAVEGAYSTAYANTYAGGDFDTATPTSGEFGSDYTGYGAADTATDPYGMAYGGDGGDRASGTGDRLKGKAGELRGKAGELRGKAGEYSSRARMQARRYARQTGQMYSAHPLTMGVMAMAVGAALGAVLPRTQREDEVLGEASERAMRLAREQGLDAMERAKTVADRTARAARDDATAAMRDETRDLNAGNEGSTSLPH